MNDLNKEELCPCGSQLAFRICCEPLIAGKQKAETAEQLMRSRYTAFYKGEVDYLISTWHPTKRQENNRERLLNTIHSCQWLSLKVLDISAGKAEDSTGTVEFRAIYQEQKLEVMQECSKFIKEEGQWYYLEGEAKKPELPGRNEPCWCGSGKKTKKCHGQII